MIRASGLGKTYRLYDRPIDRLIELFAPRPRHRVFPALSDVSFEIAQGETIGIIGQNGAGKSTLLKLLCRITQPSSGSLETRGTIASILELGTGFHPEFTGRDNAELSATILGLSPQQVREKLPDILEFSELGRFLDQPVKTYSSGMYMRLAFAVAVNVDPDILIIDEALAVGDGHFQKKCVDRIREFQERGKTILFCSHAMYFITTLCSKTMWINQGKLVSFGRSADVVHEYETFLMAQDARTAAEDRARQDQEPETHSPVRIRSIELETARGNPSTMFATGDDIRVRIRIDADDPRLQIHLLLGVCRAADEMQCFAAGTHPDGLPPLSGRTSYEVVLDLQQVPLLRGDYSLILYAGDEKAVHVYDRADVRPAFSIAGDRFEIGMIDVHHRWDLAAAPEMVAASR